MACSCCLLTDAVLMEGSASIVENVISMSVDTTIDALRDTKSDDDCNQISNEESIYFGPSKGTLQLSAYPFRQGEDYSFGFVCPVNIHVTFPFKYIFDCSVCQDCYNPLTGAMGRRRGAWRGVPNSKKSVVVEGDLGGALPIQVGGCAIPAAKFQIQAGPTPVVSPPQTMQYSWINYFGLPLSFDSRDTMVYDFSLDFGTSCPGGFPFRNVKAYMTSFSFNFAPPKVPVVQYGFDVMLGLCPPDC